jgi:hypothetical protein
MNVAFVLLSKAKEASLAYWVTGDSELAWRAAWDPEKGLWGNLGEEVILGTCVFLIQPYFGQFADGIAGRILRLQNTEALMASSALSRGAFKAVHGFFATRIPFFAMTSVADGVFFSTTGYAQGYAAYKATGEGAQIYSSWPAFMSHLKKNGMSGLLHSIATAAAFRAHGGMGGHFERGSFMASLRVARESTALAVYRSASSMAEKVGTTNFAARLSQRVKAIEERRAALAAELREDLTDAAEVPPEKIDRIVKESLEYVYTADTDARRWGVPDELMRGEGLPPSPNWSNELEPALKPVVHGVDPVPETKPEDQDTPF